VRLSECEDCSHLIIGFHKVLKGNKGVNLEDLREYVGWLSIFRVDKSFGLRVAVWSRLAPSAHHRSILRSQCSR
jgi:hypothetical protein